MFFALRVSGNTLIVTYPVKDGNGIGYYLSQYITPDGCYYWGIALSGVNEATFYDAPVPLPPNESDGSVDSAVLYLYGRQNQPVHVYFHPLTAYNFRRNPQIAPNDDDQRENVATGQSTAVPSVEPYRVFNMYR